MSRACTTDKETHTSRQARHLQTTAAAWEQPGAGAVMTARPPPLPSRPMGGGGQEAAADFQKVPQPSPATPRAEMRCRHQKRAGSASYASRRKL